MNRPPVCVYAFTLLEMMIAIGLGTMVILVAMAGFRTASQTITVANRLSLENSLLRSGYYEAQVQLDYWTNLDDPTKDDTERPLKNDLSVGTINEWTYQNRPRGLPFTPMTTQITKGIWTKSGIPFASPTNITLPDGSTCKGNWVMPRTTSDIKTSGLRDTDRGWDPSYYWAPHDPRTWCRANLGEKLRDNGGIGNDGANNLPKMINGRYAIFGNTISTAQTLASYGIRKDLNSANQADRDAIITVDYKAYPSKDIHTWYYNQLNSLVNAMGYAAFCEYVPANAIYTWYSNTGDRTAGGINQFGVVPWYQFSNGDGDQRNSRGIYRNTYSCSYGYLNPRTTMTDLLGYQAPHSSRPNPSFNELFRQHFYWSYQSDYGATDGDGARRLRWFTAHINLPEKLQSAKPDTWPDIDVSVGRLIKNAHHVAVAKVRRYSPVTGELIELSWCGLGTTLRGARQQRHPSKGWASWDNASSAIIDPNLDTP